jgi:acyl-CoA synthetase (NDP forming)
LKCYPSLTEIPDEIDSVWIALPNKIVLDTLEEADSNGVKVALFIKEGVWRYWLRLKPREPSKVIRGICRHR